MRSRQRRVVEAWMLAAICCTMRKWLNLVCLSRRFYTVSLPLRSILLVNVQNERDKHCSREKSSSAVNTAETGSSAGHPLVAVTTLSKPCSRQALDQRRRRYARERSLFRHAAMWSSFCLSDDWFRSAAKGWDRQVQSGLASGTPETDHPVA